MPETYKFKVFKPKKIFSIITAPKKRQKVTTLPDQSGLPPPTPKQIQKYSEKHREIVQPIVLSSLRKHKTDVLHGSQSLARLIPDFRRTPKDWDIFSRTEKKRALQFEKAIDESVGANIAETRHVPIPTKPYGPEDTKASKDLYRVMTPDVKEDADIDVMNRPHALETVRKGGITHQTLEQARERSLTRARLQPMKSFKAYADARDIERHLRKKEI